MSTFHIALTCPKPEAAQRYSHALSTALTKLGIAARIDVYPDVGCGTSPQASFAVVWAPTQAFVDCYAANSKNATTRAIFSLGAGVDALLKLQMPADVPVVRLEDSGMGRQMADYVSHAVTRHVRQFDVYEAAMRKNVWQPLQPRLKADFPIGVMGLGVLGAQVAQQLQQLGYPVRGWARSAKSLSGIECYVGTKAFDAFLAATRILVCLLPLTPETEGVMNGATLAKLQAHAYVINVARGAHLVEADLCALIDSGHIAGATLDVFQTEPLAADHPFHSYPQISLTPHICAQTIMADAAAQIAHKMQAMLRGEKVTGQVDWSKAY